MIDPWSRLKVKITTYYLLWNSFSFILKLFPVVPSSSRDVGTYPLLPSKPCKKLLISITDAKSTHNCSTISIFFLNIPNKTQPSSWWQQQFPYSTFCLDSHQLTLQTKSAKSPTFWNKILNSLSCYVGYCQHEVECFKKTGRRSSVTTGLFMRWIISPQTFGLHY